MVVACANLFGGVSDEAARPGLRSTRWAGRLQVIAHQPRVMLDGGHNPAAMMKAGTALRRLIGTERLVAVFAMLSERDPAQLLDALRILKPDAAVFTEPASAAGHAVSAGLLSELYGTEGQEGLPAAPARHRARELAGPQGTVLWGRSPY